jgi:pimeloyl-ACP methyl ester carboxylesterase
VAPLLSDDFQVIVPDRLGYGRTGGQAGGFQANALALVHLLDRLNVERATVVGYSWGGGVALALAELHPDRVAGLVLAASVGPDERFGWDDRMLAAPMAGEAIAALTLGAAGRVLSSAWVRSIAERRLGPRALEGLDVLNGMTSGPPGTTVWRSFVVEQRAMLRELEGLGPGLTCVRTPTVVLNGSDDHVVPPEVGDRLAASIPDATHTVVAGGHHLLPHFHPDAIAAAVREAARAAKP